MGIYAEKACKYFNQGYNCAQSTLLAFAPLIGFDEETTIFLYIYILHFITVFF